MEGVGAAPRPGGRSLLNYEHGMEAGTGAYVMAYVGAGIIAALFVLVLKPELVKMVKRFELRHDANGPHWLHRVEQWFGSYYTFMILSALAHLVRAIVVQNFAHTDGHDGTPAGWEAFARLFGLTYFQALASLTLSAKNAWFTAKGTAHHPVVKWFVRILAFCFIVLSVVALGIPKDSGIAMGVTLIAAAVPVLATNAVAIRVDTEASLRESEGRFFICVFATAMIACGAWVLAWEDKCAQKNARCDGGCPFEDDLNHQFWFHLFFVLSTGVLSKALVTLPPSPEEPFRKRVETFHEVPDPSDPSSNPPANPAPVKPKPAKDPKPPAHADPPTEAPVVNPTVNPGFSPAGPDDGDNGGASASGGGGGGGGGYIEDALLPKMYKLFTRADDGTIDVADAGLTSEEFSARVTVAKLQETLLPIGGLDLSRVDPKLKDAKGDKVPVQLVFQTLDADGNKRVTCKEFIELLRRAAPKAFGRVVEDSCLRKMYELFSTADSGVIDVADARLTKAEFKASITIARLQSTLEPVGGLDLARLDPKLAQSSETVTIDRVFALLDKNGDDAVTMTEFVKLLRKKAAAGKFA